MAASHSRTAVIAARGEVLPSGLKATIDGACALEGGEGWPVAASHSRTVCQRCQAALPSGLNATETGPCAPRVAGAAGGVPEPHRLVGCSRPVLPSGLNATP